ncbi:MAG: hypothetical protein HQM14_08350 [SAR324 cluster bacterium]|nr:hypothetical protein [SAR324 cluster bacterium]
MKIRYFISIFLSLCWILFLFGCDQASDSSMQASFKATPSGENLYLRVNAPETVQSILIEVRATEVDTEGFGSSFNILSNRKVIYRDSFEDNDDVLIAIQPGVIEVSVYAFSGIIPVTGITDLDAALYYGKTEAVTVGVGEEKEVPVSMLTAVNVSISNMAVTEVDGNYALQFQTDQELPAGTHIQVLYNDENPDYLEFAEENNQTVSTETSGSSHTVSLTSGTIPYFVKVEIDSTSDQSFYRGTETKICDTCGSLPLVIYDRKIAAVDDTALSQGIIKTWKTTTYSGASAYFSKGFFDQIFATKQVASGYALANLGIYQLDAPIFYNPSDSASATAVGSSCANVAGSSCAEISANAESNAPAGFFDEVSVLISTQITQDLTTGAYFANTAECSEELSRLGQDCSSIPRVGGFSIENDQLFLDVYLGENSRLEFYTKESGLSSTPVASVALSFPVPDTTGGVAQTAGIDYKTLLPDLTKNYFGRVVNDNFEGSLLDLNVANWADTSGVGTAETFAAFVNVETIEANSVRYYSLDLQAGQTYTIAIEGLKGAVNLWEAYLINSSQMVVKSLSNDLLGSEMPEKTSFAVTPETSGTYYLKLVNPLTGSLPFILTVE